MPTDRAHVWFSGHVQGVGFRWRAREIAVRHDVTGFVRNLRDGRVELVLDGGRTEVQECLERIEAALDAHIRQRNLLWEAADPPHPTFDIRP